MVIKQKLALCLCGALVAAATGCSRGKPSAGKKLSVRSRAALEKVLEINELQSLEYIYNSYAIDCDDGTKAAIALFDAFFSHPLLTEADYAAAQADFAALTDAADWAFAALYADFLQTHYGLSGVNADEAAALVSTVVALFSTTSDYAAYSEAWHERQSAYTAARKDRQKAQMTYAVAYRGHSERKNP